MALKRTKKSRTSRTETVAAEKTAKSVPSGGRQLYRSKDNRIIAGVCGGLGDYFDTDPVWFRLAFVVLLFMSGVGLITYILMWIIVPEEGKLKGKAKAEVKKGAEKSHADRRGDGRVYFGVILVILGVVFLSNNLFPWFGMRFLWPVLLIVFGIYLLGMRRSR